ncbi:protein shortage in chiasmata 1 ortholog [Phaethornis superciliosus]
MFAALKYHATDYLYETMARQKFSISRLSLCFPPCLQQDEKYHLNGLFADDKYRKPWTRITSTQNMLMISALDEWKKSLSVEDFLRKKPMSCEEFLISNELVDIIPSSNPSSPTEVEKPFLLKKSDFEEECMQEKYFKTDYATEFKEQWQDLYLEEEFVFIDNLENFRKKLPTSSVLQSRLQVFLVKDPLLDSEGWTLTEENVFGGCLTFQNEMEMQDNEKEFQEIKENFCTIPLKDEENFMLPVPLEFCKPSNGRSDSLKIPSHLDVKELLNLAPETLSDEDMCRDLIKEDLKAEITYKIEVSKYCPVPKEVSLDDSRSILEFCESAKCIPYLKEEMEVPLTPPCRQQRSWVNFLCTELQEEPIPLSSNSILITEPSREYLESLIWQSEKYRDNMSSLLLVEHQTVGLARQHYSLIELKEMLPVEVEEPMLSSLEEGWWLHLGLNPVTVETLEQLNVDATYANSLLPREVETFTKFTSYNLEKWLEENTYVTSQELLSAEKHQSEKVINLDLSPQTQKQHFAPRVSAASPAKVYSINTSVEEITGGSIKQHNVEEAVYFLNEEKKTTPSSESVTAKEMSFKRDNSPSDQEPSSLELPTKWGNDDSDLSNFIMLRSKHTLTQRDGENDVDSPAKESQCQAYCLLEEAATPILKDLTHLGVLASVNWSFDSIQFDHTRFFLKQQEKVICDRFNEGKIDENEIMLFRHAALVHLLVTVRDLLLTCGLDTAIGYLSKAKDIYKNILESSLNNIWRQLKIVQYSSQKKHETNPKITELQSQMLKWMQSNGKEHSVKILIITRMDSEREKGALIHSLSKVEGLKAVDLNSDKKGTFLGCKDIISNRYSCIIVHNQQIGADFPWTHFSLVMEYDYSENSCWNNLCKKLNVTYMTFKTTLPETIQMGSQYGSFLLEVQIPYVFLTTEGLLNMQNILQLLESKYNITFVERSSNYSLSLFGSAARYVVLTIDECTAIFLQSMEELNYEKSCDNVISKLMALSLQYTCCWIVFYSRERLDLEYSLRGDTLVNLALIYATLIELTQKSEDFEVKVVLTPGIEETALVIRQIADNILLASHSSPHEWLDKSWLSVLPSEKEKCLLTFPCINPLVAQWMLKKESSLNKLFLASFDQLQELLPEVPKKVLKHFSEMTSSYSVKAAAPLEAVVKAALSPGNMNNFNTFCPDFKPNHQSLDLLSKAQNSTGPPHINSEAIITPLNHRRGFLDSDLPSYMQKKSCSSEVITRKKQNFFAVPKDCEDFAHLDATNSLHDQRQPFGTQYSSDQSSKNSGKEDFFSTFSDYATQESSKNFLEEFGDATFKTPEVLIDQTPWDDPSPTGPCGSFVSDGLLSNFFADPDELQSLNFHQIDSGFSEASEFKNRRLTYERVPGRRDGQTRLKFF